jgi:hypothetical protein
MATQLVWPVESTISEEAASWLSQVCGSGERSLALLAIHHAGRLLMEALVQLETMYDIWPSTWQVI